MFDQTDPDLIRDFTNAKGSRYTKMRWGVACARDNLWFCLIKYEDVWMAAFRDLDLEVEIKFRIIPENGGQPIKALHAYRAALDTYAAFVLGDQGAVECFETIDITTSETKH